MKLTLNKKDYYVLTTDQAGKALRLCLDNAESYLQDIDISVNNKKYDHLFIPLSYAVEEIGKARMLLDGLCRNYGGLIVITTDITKDHRLKLNQAIEYMHIHRQLLLNKEDIFPADERILDSDIAIWEEMEEKERDV